MEDNRYGQYTIYKYEIEERYPYNIEAQVEYAKSRGDKQFYIMFLCEICEKISSSANGAIDNFKFTPYQINSIFKAIAFAVQNIDIDCDEHMLKYIEGKLAPAVGGIIRQSKEIIIVK
ncbi:MAG: hypothetical protein KID00_14520 [Clostridium argentinense]|uniref:Uncharacterized protein n=1 Tax=Clostridium faecium TaxID=2762223 RepID=A0ABR8YQZ7_9CLOT|nr:MULTISPECIES: hypothetical protein [Clostridium]MBD8046679.1 hypothetical protein [Clostridium faecium]MBS5825037.1 hypothetical protein [Clostridium argentinense]MDU1350081.1 hypothetical protein [Clostridium argentinense]